MSDNLEPFVVYVPYRTDKEAVDRRSSFRSEHAAGIAKLRESGSLQQVIIHLIPPAVNSESVANTKPEFQGATLILKVGDYKEATDIIQSDIYWKEDIWNKEEITICPALIIY